MLIVSETRSCENEASRSFCGRVVDVARRCRRSCTGCVVITALMSWVVVAGDGEYNGEAVGATGVRVVEFVGGSDGDE